MIFSHSDYCFSTCPVCACASMSLRADAAYMYREKTQTLIDQAAQLEALRTSGEAGGPATVRHEKFTQANVQVSGQAMPQTILTPNSHLM